jgi:hypothetical protein
VPSSPLAGQNLPLSHGPPRLQRMGNPGRRSNGGSKRRILRPNRTLLGPCDRPKARALRPRDERAGSVQNRGIRVIAVPPLLTPPPHPNPHPPAPVSRLLILSVGCAPLAPRSLPSAGSTAIRTTCTGAPPCTTPRSARRGPSALPRLGWGVGRRTSWLVKQYSARAASSRSERVLPLAAVSQFAPSTLLHSC